MSLSDQEIEGIKLINRLDKINCQLFVSYSVGDEILEYFSLELLDNLYFGGFDLSKKQVRLYLGNEVINCLLNEVSKYIKMKIFL